MADPITVKLTLKERFSDMTFEGPIEEAIVAAMHWARDHRWEPIEVTVAEGGKGG